MLLMDKKQKIIGAALAAGAVAIGIVGYGESKKIEAAKKSDNFLQASKCIETLSECKSIIKLNWLSEDLGLKVASRISEQQSIEAIENPARKCIEREGADFYCKDLDKSGLKKVNPSLYKELNNVLWAEKQRKKKAEEQRVIAAKKAEERRRIAAERATWGPWRYDTYTDDASGKSASRAILRSENTVTLSWPYDDPQNGTIVIRQHPRWGFDAFFRIESGQILSQGGWDSNQITVRFDGGGVETWYYNKAQDGSSDVIFLRNAEAFEKRLKRSKLIYITPTLYGSGQRTFRFKVKGYDSTKV